MGMKSKKNIKSNTPGKKNTKKMKKFNETKKNDLLKKRLKTVLEPSTSNSERIEIKPDNSSKAMNSSLISSAINDKKFILNIPSECDEYFKKQPTNVQTNNKSADKIDQPNVVNGSPPLHSQKMTKTNKQKKRKSKNNSKPEENGTAMMDLLKEVKKSINPTQNEVINEAETNQTKTAFEESKQAAKPVTLDKHTAKPKLPKSKKFKNISKQTLGKDVEGISGKIDKNNKKKTKAKDNNLNSHKNETFKPSQDDCSEPERKKPCKKSKQTKTEKKKAHKSEKPNKKNKNENKFISPPKEDGNDVPVEKKVGNSDSDRSSYILQFFDENTVDSRDEQMDESESIYEDESDYNDLMSESEIEEENEEREGDSAIDVEPEQEKMKKSNQSKEDDDKNLKLMKKHGKLMSKKEVGAESKEWNESPRESVKAKCAGLNMTTVADFLGEESVDGEDDDEEDNESADDEEDNESADDEDDNESADDDEDNESEDESILDREMAEHWKNFCTAFNTDENSEDENDHERNGEEFAKSCLQTYKPTAEEENSENSNCSSDDFESENSEDSEDISSLNRKKAVHLKKFNTLLQAYKATVEKEKNENSNYSFLDDYDSEHSYETDEEEYDSFVEDEDSIEYDDEEETSSFSEEFDEDDSYGYDFQEESDDEDYQLPEGEVEDIIVRRGKATIYDMDENNISFDSDSPQIIELGKKASQAECGTSQSTALVRLISNKSRNDPDSDDSCPQLVPINYNLATSDYYDYEFTEDDEETDDGSYELDSENPDEAAYSPSECQEANGNVEFSECKLITTDGEKTVAYNLLGTNSLQQNADVEQEEEAPKKTMEKRQAKNKVDKKTKKRRASETFADENQSQSEAKPKGRKKKLEEMKTESDEKNTDSKSLLYTAPTQEIKVDSNSNETNLEVVEEATRNFQIKKEDVRTSVQNEELAIPKPQGWQNEVNLNTKSLFFNSFHSRYVLILLKDYLYFNGALKIKLLLGSAEVFGYDLQRDEEVQSYSIYGGAFLDLSPKRIENPVTIDEIDKQLSFYSQDFLSSDVAQIKKEFDKSRDALILLARNDNTKKIEMVRRYMKENLFPNMTGLNVASSSYTSQFILHSVFHNFDRNRCITFNHQWRDINLKSNTKLAIIGGKSVGKSTLLRYTINRHLKKFNKILLIDLDIGQQEMFVPQTITATIVEKPILGPGYLFTNAPTKSLLFGYINVVISPLSYIRNVAELFKFCYEQNEFNDIPWLINTMGYTQGLGEELTAAVFNIAKPNLVVQIQSRKQKENFNRDMHPGNIRNIRSAILSEWLDGIQDLSYELKVFRSVSGGGYGRFRMNAKDSRLCMILARLGTILKEQHDWLTDVRPFSVTYDDISIVTFSEHSVDDKESLLDIINANLIYLCKKVPGSETTECYGIGIVRGVDKAQKKVFVIASLEVATLSLVNTLAICNIPVPTSLLLNQGPKVKGSIPYTYNTQNNAFTKHIYQYNSAHFFKAGRSNR